MVDIAITNDIDTFIYIPEEFKTYEMCEMVVKDDACDWLLEDIPAEFQEELAQKYDLYLEPKAKGR